MPEAPPTGGAMRGPALVSCRLRIASDPVGSDEKDVRTVAEGVLALTTGDE